MAPGPAATPRKAIVEAIAHRQTLAFVYNGRQRLVEPQCLGIGSKGTELLRGHQIAGGSQKEPLFDVARMAGLAVLERRFTQPGPNYTRNDSAMTTILAQL